MKLSQLMAAAAVAGLVAAGASNSVKADHHDKAPADAKKAEKNHCKGKNHCDGKKAKGKKADKKAKNACGGPNGCGGKMDGEEGAHE